MRWIPLFSLVALFMASCTSSRYASSTEYDDVYFTKADRVAEAAAISERASAEPATQYSNDDYSNSPRTYSNRQVDNYGDYYYEDDDFTFSRRMRRFNTASSANWRYYDPYFSNDLYFVMGTSYWNRWNNFGWYDWNRPRFGAFNYGYDPFFNDPFFNNGWGGFGTYSYNYYNPWVGSFYGYNPGYGAFNNGFRNGYYAGFNNGFNTGFWGGNAYYCPPITTRTGGNGLWNQAAQNRAPSRAVTSSRRSTPGNTGAVNRTPSRRSVNNATPNNHVATKTAPTTDYTRPRTRDSRRVYSTDQPTNSNAAPTRTTGSRPSSTTSSRTTRQSSTSRQPRTSSNRQRNTTNSASPSRTTRPSTSTQRTQRQPRTSSSRPPRSSSSPSRTTRPSASPSRTSRPSTSSRPSSSSRSSARPSSSSRSSSRPSSSRPRRP